MKNLVIIILTFVSTLCNAQVELTYSTTQYCSEGNKGTISIDLIHKSGSTWAPPYLVEFENVDEILFGELSVDENTFDIVDLDFGKYIVTVHLHEETVLETDYPYITNETKICSLSYVFVDKCVVL